MWIDDDVLRQCQTKITISTWIPEQALVVLGNANIEEQEVYSERCRRDGVPVLKRYGGGGAVVLYPGCVVASIGCWVKSQFDNGKYFRLINGALAAFLEEHLDIVSGTIIQKGISDLCVGDRKFAGTSLFRSKNYLCYQASLICDLDVTIISDYLRHPSKEPDYRSSRNHADFLMGLTSLDNKASPSAVSSLLQHKLEAQLVAMLGEDLIEPQQAQMQNIQARVARSNS